MCELFAMSGRYPATVNVSLAEFARHGGQTDEHKDGWGIAFFEGPDALVLREPHAASDSAGMEFVRTHDLPSNYVISHIRKATQGGISLKNTQPYSRELGGRMHVFVHNGMLHDVESRYPTGRRFLPVGDTDSEYAFCLLMNRMADACQGGRLPGDAIRIDIFAEFAAEMAKLGPANFIYSDGDLMLAHGHKRTHDDGIHPPGLHYLCRSCKADPQPVSAEGLSIVTDADTQDIVLLASVPLTDENWTAMSEGMLLVLRGGEIIESRSP